MCFLHEAARLNASNDSHTTLPSPFFTVHRFWRDALLSPRSTRVPLVCWWLVKCVCFRWIKPHAQHTTYPSTSPDVCAWYACTFSKGGVHTCRLYRKSPTLRVRQTDDGGVASNNGHNNGSEACWLHIAQRWLMKPGRDFTSHQYERGSWGRVAEGRVRLSIWNHAHVPSLRHYACCCDLKYDHTERPM